MKVLVVGGDASIGRALSTALRARGDRVISTTRRLEQREGDGWIKLDLAGPLIDLPDCDVAFFCAAIASFEACRNHPQLAERVNVSAPAELAARLVARGTRSVLLSTSAVLDCAEPRMRAERPYAPRGLYGVQKAAAERALLRLGPKATVLRLSKVFAQGDKRLADWASSLRRRQPVRAFNDHRISPLTLDQAIHALLALADSGEEGIYQASGAEDLSYAEVAYDLARRLGASPDLVRPCSAAGAGIPADEITPYSSLDASRLTHLCGFKPPPASTVLERTLV